ncbi:MAG: zinc ribbon domain-containing protein, partial [Methanothrix soehngenii]|nr:zinc ribbon domain-containing protein [Methanothrix soehngenii]
MTTQAPRFWRSIPQRYNLLGTHCNRCNEYFFPPRNLCP